MSFRLMWIGTLALAGIGIPGIGGFAGFHSKDVILESAYAAHSAVGGYAFWLGIVAAFLTAFYSCRLMFLTFHGKPHDHHHYDHAHESPPSMLIPLYVLAAGAIVAGFLGEAWFVGHHEKEFWRASVLILDGHHALHGAHDVPTWVKWSPLVVAVAGIALAYWFYVKSSFGLPRMMVDAFPAVHRFFFNKWYFDELYDRLFVRPSFWLGRQLWKKGDVGIIDGVGPNGLAAGSQRLAGVLGRTQSGYLYHYAFAMLIGVALLVTWYMLSRGR